MQTPSLFACALALLLALAFAPTARGQLPPAYGRRPNPVERDARYRDWVLDSLKKSKGAKPSEEDLKRAYEQVRKDFERIQVLNNDILRATAPGREPDYKLVAAATEEINRCASRLDESLALPQPPEEQLRTRSHDDVSVSVLLSAFDGLIVGFVRNPTFKEAAVVDSAAAPRARRDLLLIIRLSKHLAGRAKALSKAGGSR